MKKYTVSKFNTYRNKIDIEHIYCFILISIIYTINVHDSSQTFNISDL